MANYYVSSLAIGGGDGSLSSPWTLSESVANAVAGDDIIIMADGEYIVSSPLSFPVAGSSSGYVRVIGANAYGIIDGTKPVLNGATLTTGSDIFRFNVASQCFEIENIEFRNSPQHAIYTGTNTVYGRINRCDFKNCAGSGVITISSSSTFEIIYSKFTECSVGVGSLNTLRFSNSIIMGCQIVNNGTGIYCGTNTHIINNIFIGNGIAIRANAAINGNIIIGNTFFKCTGNAIQFYSGANRYLTIVNNIFRLNLGYAIHTQNTPLFVMKYFNNCFSDNSLGDTDLGTVSGHGNIHSDPLFISEVSGNEDLRLQSTSPCINAGINPYGY